MAMAEGMGQSLNFVFKESHGCQCLPVDVPCHSQALFTGPLLQVPGMVIGSADPLLVVGPGFQLGSTGGSLSWFLHQLATVPPAMEALLNRVEDFLVDILCHLCITWIDTGCPLQLIDLIIYLPDLIPGCARPNESHGRRLHPQVSFGGRQSLAPANGPIMLFLPCCLSVSKHFEHDKQSV